MSLTMNPLLSSIGVLTLTVHSLITKVAIKTVFYLCHRRTTTGKVLMMPGTTIFAVKIIDLSVKNLFEMKT